MGHDGEKWADLPTHWGWKDPRNTITLAEWLRRFPQAKVIHIVRDQQAVANSIFKRHQFLLGLQYKEGIPATFPLEKLLYTHMVMHSHRAAVLAEARLIWEEYEAIAAQHRKNHPQTPWLSLQYEALLQNPLPQLQSIAEFCGLTPPSLLCQNWRNYCASQCFKKILKQKQLDKSALPPCKQNQCQVLRKQKLIIIKNYELFVAIY